MATMDLGRVAGPGGAEPPRAGLGLVHELHRSVRGSWRDAELFRYVYAPWEPQIESPRPYFHPVRTLSGEPVTLYRPYDHVWHKGIALSLCNVDEENFWGGPTYQPGEGYRQLDNNGSMRHLGFDLLDVRDDLIRITERLVWVTRDDRRLLAERRRVAAEVLPSADAWRLVFGTELTNISGSPVRFGSPTTRGRDNAGYGGLFWRGPRSFAGGRFVTPDGEGGDELMGSRGAWMAFTGKHDGQGTASSVLFVDDPANFSFPSRWFARCDPYAVLSPAPFFDEEFVLRDGETLTLRYDVFIADGPLDRGRGEKLARRASERDLLADDPDRSRR